ncbi:MAG: hypothetical protein IJV80_01950, partial [Clostridia bacterium]|nr:hypothetical protein [Clostridia bacterium]
MKKLLVPLCMLLSGACALAAAACEETTHTVTFNANYGQFDDATSSRSVLVKDKKKVEEQTPSREGWKFEYWALNGQEYNFEDKVEGSFTLDAVYTPVDFHTVSFTPVEGADFYYEGVNYNVTDWNNVPTIEIKVTVELDAFYAGTPVLMANDVSYNPVDGAYIIPINADTTITAVGVADDVSNMSGNGTEAEPFLVSRPIDLIKIAQEVNEGDEVYRTAFYQLQNDIDLKGHELDVIGNGQDLANGDFAYFAGSFSGMGYTIKNFEINTDGSEYAGLFGVVNAGSITHLNIEDYTINATVNDSAVYCGSFVGYGIGANVLVCGTKNGTLNVNAAENYFSYVGGAIGFQYSAYDPNLDVSYVSAASYLSVHTRIYANSGLIYSAGGIVGYAACENEFTPSYVNHCYTNSIVTGAVVSGGVVGYLGRYASIVDCYATGDVWAQNPSALGIEEFEYVYAGGIAGYAENDTVVYESFATGSVNAYSSKGEAYQNANGLVGGNDPQNFVEMGTNAVLLQNCYYALNGKNGTVDLTSTEFLKTNLNWKDYDWTFVEGQYPTVNLEGTSTTFKVTIEFGAGNTVDGYTKNVIPITDIYLPFGMWVKNGDFKATFLSDGGKMANGYYFDAAFEKPVPTGYIPTRDVTLYVNFSNYAEVAGQYFLLNAHTSNVVPLTLNADGTYSYVDGNNTYSSTYVYNDKDKTILFKDARFSRYAETDSTALDRYMLRDYAATFSSGTLTITDNAFFTTQSPLIAKQGGFVVGEYYIVKDGNANLYTFYSNNTGVSVVNGVRTEFTYALNEDVIYVNNAEFATYSNGTIISSDGEFSKMDVYKGVWEQTSTVRKELSLDGMGNWSYVHYVNVKAGNSIQKNILDQAAGTYTVQDSSILFYQQSTLLADGAFNEDGFLCVMNETFYRKNSFKGVWQDFYHGATLTLNGITNA